MKRQSNRWNPKRIQQAVLRSPARALLLAMVLAGAGAVAIHLSSAAPETPPANNETPGPAPIAEQTPEQIIVKYKAGVGEAETESVAEAAGANEKAEIPQLRTKVLKVPKEKRAEILAKLKADPRVEYAEPDVELQLAVTRPNDPEYSKQWVWPTTMTDLLWDKHKGGSLTVAVVDTGINAHPDLAGKIVSGGYDVVNNDSDPADDHGHGTAVASIIAANTNNAAGMAGGCWSCRVLPIKVADAAGKINASTTSQGIVRAADSGAKIINLSLGSTDPTAAVEDAVNYAVGKGAIIVAAAGNSGIDEANYPAAYPNAISVAATDPDDGLSSYSTFHSTVDIAAPGRHRVAVYNGTDYKDMQGTSFATPTVASILAVLWSAFPGATPAQLRDAIVSTADTCCDSKIPGGRINSMKAYNKLAGTLNADTTKPTISFVSPGTEGMNISGTAVPVTFNIGDNVGVVKLHIQLNGSAPALTTVAPFATLTINTTSLQDIDYTITGTAYDAAGNYTRVSRTVHVNNAAPDTVKPTATLTGPADGAAINGTVQLTGNVSDNVGIAKVMWYVDNALKFTDVTSPYDASWNTTSETAGQHTLKLVAYDSNGNITELSRTYTVNNSTTPPPTTPPPTTPPPTTPPPTTPPPTTPPPGGNPKPADINGSGKVDLTDLSILLSNWNKTTANADLNSSGKVDLTDLSMLLSKWNTGG